MQLAPLFAASALLTVHPGKAQDPSYDFQIATPALASSTVTASEPEVFGDRITVQFREAKVGEVLSFLEKHGINFVVSSQSFDKDATLTLSVTEVPLQELVDSIALAFGGRWEKTGSTLVFQKGTNNTRILHFNETGPGQDVKLFDGLTFDKEAFKNSISPDMAKKLGDIGLEMGKKFGPEFQRKLELQFKGLREIPGLPPQTDLPRPPRPPKAPKPPVRTRDRAEVIIDGKPLPELNLAMPDVPEAGAEAMRAQAEAIEAQAEAMKDAEAAMKEGAEAMDKAMAKQPAMAKVFRIEVKNEPRARKVAKIVINHPKLAASLTTNQKALHRKQGFLKSSQLSREQKNMIQLKEGTSDAHIVIMPQGASTKRH